MFDVRSIPFSRRGAWINLSPVTALHTTDHLIHLVSHQNGMHAVLSLAPEVNGRAADASTLGTPASLMWNCVGGGEVEAVFERTDAIRVRGRGAYLRISDAAGVLTPFTGCYLYVDSRDGSAVFTSYETGHRYRITMLEGPRAVLGSESLGRDERGVVVGDDRPWEAVIEEMDAAREPYVVTGSFEEARDGARADYADYVAAIAPWRSVKTPAAELAVYVLWSATVAPKGYLQRESILMSKHWMDKVWSWDHCFNAIATVGLPDLALAQFLTPFDHQDESGALPDSVTHSEVLYNYVKPPIHGWALDRLRAEGVALDESMLKDIYGKLAKWTRFWLDARRAPGRALPYYQHGNDSGWDNSTAFDHDRTVESPDLAAFLLVQLDVLARLAEEIGEDRSPWDADAAALGEALVGELWRGDCFVARGVTSGVDSKRTSLLTLLPLLASPLLKREYVAPMIEGVRRMLTQFGPATQRVESPEYEPDGYWRGPIWAPSTMLIEDGLRRAGATELADDVSARFRRLCERSGFAENFDALTGVGLRDRAYTWTASVYLVLCRDAARREGEG
jgi:hypothetical protein